MSPWRRLLPLIVKTLVGSGPPQRHLAGLKTFPVKTFTARPAHQGYRRAQYRIIADFIYKTHLNEEFKSAGFL